MFALYDQFISIRVFGAGRRLYALRQVKERATRLDRRDLVRLVDAAIAHDQERTQPLNAAWKVALRAPQPTEAERRNQ